MASHPTTTPAPQPPDNGSPSRRRIALWIGGGVIVAGLAWLAWSLLGPAPDAVTLDDAVAAVDDTSAGGDATEDAGTASDGDDSSASSSPTGGGTEADVSSDTAEAVVDGTWSVDTSVEEFSIDDTSGTFVGFRIAEELSSVGSTTAIGRTPVVSGTVTLEGQELADATITGDLTAIESDESRRENAIQRALDTGTNPAATFELTQPVDLGAAPTVGAPIEVDATGTLSINGVTQPVTIPLGAVWTGDVVVVTGSVDVALEDFDVTAPSAPIVVSVADDATVEFQLYLSR